LIFEAADVFPKIKLEVCLSAPVVFDTKDVPANMIYNCHMSMPKGSPRREERRHTAQKPHMPIIREPTNMSEARGPTEVVFHAKNADRLAAKVRGTRKG
jgi:hypothetical protein